MNSVKNGKFGKLNSVRSVFGKNRTQSDLFSKIWVHAVGFSKHWAHPAFFKEKEGANESQFGPGFSGTPARVILEIANTPKKGL